MILFREAFLLFSLNLLDALLTIVWVRNGVAEEANSLMAKLLEMGDLSFLGAKLAIGAFTAFVFIRTADRRLSRYGISLALAVYVSLMGVHLMTGLTAAGLISSTPIQNFRILAASALALFIA
jgi:hypothetical protein